MSSAALIAAAPALPLHKAGPYVAAAYVVFVALLVVYLGIMALRTSRTEREVEALRGQVAAGAEEVEPEPEEVRVG